MKTKSFKSLAALFGAVVVLNISAVAGPGPQTTPVSRKATLSPQKTVVIASQTSKTADAGKAVVKARTVPQVIYETGAHGGTFVTRR